jgi:nucleoside 2-deoxyribosyltransferase
MNQASRCPVCQNEHGGGCTAQPHGDATWYACDVCGQFIVTRTLEAMWNAAPDARLPLVRRAALSRILRSSWEEHHKPFYMASHWFEGVETSLRLTTPPEIATNILRFVGDYEARTGAGVDAFPVGFYALVGAISPARANAICLEMVERGLLKVADVKRAREVSEFKRCALTFEGWERYEAERKGRFAGMYGFAALKFGDAILDPFMRDHVKPAIKEQLSYDLIDMRDAAKAGIIDNLMREKIRDAAFVLVDLTHENSGAYWEAGYAEGLGKPVLYICERAKFEAAQTHFDTNHLTTVLWEADNPSEFVGQLIATLRRSLNLFPTS